MQIVKKSQTSSRLESQLGRERQLKDNYIYTSWQLWESRNLMYLMMIQTLGTEWFST